jgi:hypothetical protein
MAHLFSSLAYLLALANRETGLWDCSCLDLEYGAVNFCKLCVKVVVVQRRRNRLGMPRPIRWEKCQGASLGASYGVPIQATVM